MRILTHFLLFVFCFPICAKDPLNIPLWPDEVPGQKAPKAPAVISENTAGNTTRLAKVTDPSLTVYKPSPGEANGAAVIVCPGGGYNILAIDKEGTEVAEWLSGLGYTAFVLQYRVPKNPAGALQDAQRAMRIVRGRADEWGVDPQKIGVLGFSAGGHLAASVSTRYEEAHYMHVDAFDNFSARPDFTILIYPAYFDLGEQGGLSPEINLRSSVPPMFMAVSSDDRHANSSLVMGAALSRAKLGYELHVFPTGGHGYGMRNGRHAAEAWPILCHDWLKRTIR
ncbi:MAG: alpha/beta hydrolase [Opitutales bacterium]